MSLSPEQQKKVLYGALAALALLVLYRVFTSEKPRTAPLSYTPGSVATSRVRPGALISSSSGDPLRLFIARRSEKFPGVARDIFRMENPAPPKPKPAPVVTAPTPTIVVPLVPVKTPEQIAAKAARADLSRFRFLGYLTNKMDKDSSLFLSKDGELFIVKSGDSVLKNYRVKDAGKDFVVLIDTATRVEMKVELSGGAEQAAQPPMPGGFPQRPR